MIARSAVFSLQQGAPKHVPWRRGSPLPRSIVSLRPPQEAARALAPPRAGEWVRPLGADGPAPRHTLREDAKAGQYLLHYADPRGRPRGTARACGPLGRACGRGARRTRLRPRTTGGPRALPQPG
jgi:hypothetical protein